MNHAPIVSIIMPVYNDEKYLKYAVESILKQTYTDFEFIIINDASTDNSEKIIKTYSDPRIRYFKNKTNQKIVECLNMAIDLSQGKYIVRMDSDDISSLKRIQYQVEYMERHPETTVCGCWAKKISSEGNIIGNMISPFSLLLKYNYWKPSPVIHPSVIIRKEKIKNFSYRNNFISVEDYDLWLRLLKKGHIFHNIAKFLFYYRIHDKNSSRFDAVETTKSSYKIFCEAYNITNINLLEYTSLCSLDFSLGFFHRLRLLFLLSSKINYPLWFAWIDNMVYFLRKCQKKIF